MVLVSLGNVVKRFGKQEVLCGTDFDLAAGRITGLLEPSGCGKTTVVKIIAAATASFARRQTR